MPKLPSDEKITQLAENLITQIFTGFGENEKINFMELVRQVNLALLSYFMVHQKLAGRPIDTSKLMDDVLRDIQISYAKHILKCADLTGIDTNLIQYADILKRLDYTEGKSSYDKARDEIMIRKPTGSKLFTDEAEEKEMKRLTIDLLELYENKIPLGWVNMANVFRADAIALVTMIVNHRMKGYSHDSKSRVISKSQYLCEAVVECWEKQLARLGIFPERTGTLEGLR